MVVIVTTVLTLMPFRYHIGSDTNLFVPVIRHFVLLRPNLNLHCLAYSEHISMRPCMPGTVVLNKNISSA